MSSENKQSSSLTLFIRAGRDGRSLGACPESQRVLSLIRLKVLQPNYKAVLNAQIVPVCTARPPESFSSLGLRLRVPAIYLNSKDLIEDTTDDIVNLLEKEYPGGVLYSSDDKLEAAAELATRDIFSRFCYFIRGVAHDPSYFEAELRKLDMHISNVVPLGGPFLLGQEMSLLDLEVLPKLHQARVASAVIKGYQIPSDLCGLWRYLHAAYSQPAFSTSCPSDSEIILHWLDCVGEGVASPTRRKELRIMYEKTAAKYSFSVPVRATPILIE